VGREGRKKGWGKRKWGGKKKGKAAEPAFHRRHRQQEVGIGMMQNEKIGHRKWAAMSCSPSAFRLMNEWCKWSAINVICPYLPENPKSFEIKLIKTLKITHLPVFRDWLRIGFRFDSFYISLVLVCSPVLVFPAGCLGLCHKQILG
jgi:hypothetical protein